MHRMTQIEFLTLKDIVRGRRVFDVAGADYAALRIIVASFHTFDLLWLASQRINFVSTVARGEIDRRTASDNAEVVSLAQL